MSELSDLERARVYAAVNGGTWVPLHQMNRICRLLEREYDHARECIRIAAQRDRHWKRIVGHLIGIALIAQAFTLRAGGFL